MKWIIKITIVVPAKTTKDSISGIKRNVERINDSPLESLCVLSATAVIVISLIMWIIAYVVFIVGGGYAVELAAIQENGLSHGGTSGRIDIYFNPFTTIANAILLTLSLVLMIYLRCKENVKRWFVALSLSFIVLPLFMLLIKNIVTFAFIAILCVILWIIFKALLSGGENGENNQSQNEHESSYESKNERNVTNKNYQVRVRLTYIGHKSQYVETVDVQAENSSVAKEKALGLAQNKLKQSGTVGAGDICSWHTYLDCVER